MLFCPVERHITKFERKVFFMSTREMICNLVNERVPNDELELLYQLILKFIPSDIPTQEEIIALQETENETEFVSHDKINWD